MINHRVTWAALALALFAVCGAWPNQVAAEVDINVGGVRVHVGGGEPPPPEVVVVLTRGPVHEAFAQPVILDEGAGFLITRQPPPPLEELVPYERPEGNHILWIPGYWCWDNDRNDFIWVSGCWRAVPPNTGWVPGYWARVQGGYLWTAGFWATADTEELEYLPAPPATLEEGPPGAGTPNSIWIPGCWVRHEGRYAWRPGFWEQARPNWIWEPAHYVYSARGCLYVEGYWDYPLDRRGVAFLPVYCPAGLYGRADFRYSPEIVIDLGVLTVNLFSSPQRHHYYFGDYYGPEYAREGFHPWYEARDRHDWYDPIFVHEQWRHHDDRQWVDNQRVAYEHRRDDKDLRPARTYDAMRAQVARLPEKERPQAQMGRPMKEVVAEKTTPFKFERQDAKAHEAAATRAKDVHAYKDQRSQWETPAASTKAGPQPKESTVPREVVKPREPAAAPGRETPPATRTGPQPKETPAPREVVRPKEPAPAPARELPKPPTREVAPPEKSPTPDPNAAVVKGRPAGEDVQPQKVKIPKSPVTVREPVREKELAPPARPKQPNPNLEARPKATKEAPDRSKDNENPNQDKKDKKDKTESSNK